MISMMMTMRMRMMQRTQWCFHMSKFNQRGSGSCRGLFLSAQGISPSILPIITIWMMILWYCYDGNWIIGILNISDKSIPLCTRDLTPDPIIKITSWFDDDFITKLCWNTVVTQHITIQQLNTFVHVTVSVLSLWVTEFDEISHL